MLGTPTATMFQDMIDAETNAERNRYQTMHNTYFSDGESMDD